MANVKNFGLIGVGGDVQFAKAGPRIIPNAGVFQLKAANGTTDTALTAAGITSSAGNVTLTTGNVVLTSTAGTVGIGGDTTLSRQAAGVFQFNGTAAVVAPTGTTAQRPTAVTGMLRVNNDTPSASLMEYYNGSSWTTLATGGTAVTSVTGITDRITSTGGTTPVIDIAPTYAGQSSITTLGTVTTGTWNAGVIAPAYGGTGVANDPGDTITLGGAISTGGALTTAGSFTTVGANALSITTTGATSVTMPTSGTLLTTDDTTNYVSSIAGTAGNIVVSGPTGAVTVNLDTVTQDASGNFVKVTMDGFGRVTGNTAVVAADITTLVDGTYVNVTGDTMSGTLTMVGATTQIVLPNAPSADTDAANKAYVDSVASGLSWKDPVQAATTAALTVTYNNGTAGVGATLTNADTQAAFAIDGVTLTVGQRVLIKDQAAPAQNGIYSVTDAGSGSTNWVLTRTVPLDQPSEFYGAAVLVTNGTINDNTGWTQTEIVTTVGTDPNIWIQFSGSNTYTWGTGLLQTGNTINVNLGAGIKELPSDEIGLDIVSGLAVQLTGTTAGDQLTFLLDGGAASGLVQSGAGLKISASGVTNAMLANSAITFTGTSGSDAVSLGESMAIIGGAGGEVSTAMGANSLAISVRDATTALKGVASFSSTNFDVTAGAVSLKAGGVNLTTDVTGILPVPNGGTGVATLGANQVMIGNGTSAVLTSSALTFSSGLLTVGGAKPLTIDGATGTITATATNGDITLVPNGTGSVIIGPVGDGLIQSDAGTALTVRGNTTLTLESGTGSTSMVLAAGTTAKVDVSGPTAAQYATGLADTNLVNKYYVDTVAGSAAGDVKAVKATFSLAANGTFNIGSALPAGVTILSVKANVTAADTGSGTLSIGKSGAVAAYMTTAENDTQTVGMYIAEDMVTEAGSVQVIGTVAGGSAGAGSVTVVVTYQLA